MEINIEEYLSHEEIKDIIVYEVKDQVKRIIGSNPEMFSSVFARKLAMEKVQELIPDFKELMDSHIKEQIRKIDLSTLFWESFGWKSNGNKLINKILAENEALIAAKIKEIFK